MGISTGLLSFEKVCNFTQAQYGTLILDGYDNTESVIHWKFDDIRKWANNKAKLTAIQGGCSYGDRRIKCLQGLVYWITYLTMHGKTVVLTDFDHQERGISMDMSPIKNDKR